MIKNYSASSYGESVAEVYDQWYEGFKPETISTLVELAQGGRVLELGIGTGRIAIPLYQAGIEVHGIDASPAMIAKLRAKPSGSNIQVTMGNFADAAVEGQFDLIYVVINTFFALPNQAEQVRCFTNVTKLLTQNGVFLIEAFIPNLARFDDNQTVRVFALEDNACSLEASQIDPIEQLINLQLIHMTNDGLRMYPLKIRYAWPSELDLMAKIAGLELRHRWGSWSRKELTDQDSKHISVYGFPD